MYYRAPGATVERNQDSSFRSPDLQTILQDNLGSSSVVVTDSTGPVKTNRYSVWGETRDTAVLPTDLGYTGQETVSNLPILYYNARWYDPTLSRFLQPDSIIPDIYNPLDLDRYSYSRNNPINYNDPSGHCIIVCMVAAVVGGIMLGTAIYSNFVHKPSVPTDGNASNFSDLMYLGYEHAGHANITGDGLQSLIDDKSVQSAQKEAVEKIASFPDYQKKAYSVDDFSQGQFTANGPSGNWVQAAKDGNPAFWMVHTGELSATNIQVSENGNFTITWHIQDKFDFIPGPEHNLLYNILASIIYPIYNGILGAEESYQTDVYWKEERPPIEKQ